MQAVLALADSSIILERRKPLKRPMTYQVIFCGIDGVVIASDRLEGVHRPEDGSIARGNDVRKIAINGEFAWAFSGGSIAKYFALHLDRMLKSGAPTSDLDIVELINNCRGEASSHWHESAEGDSGSANRVILVRGSSKSIFRINPLPGMDADMEPTKKGRCVAGQVHNTASFIFHRLHDLSASVDALAMLAAYSVRTAHDFDSSAIDGLDLAVYRDSTGKFDFADSTAYWNEAGKIDARFRQVLKELASENRLAIPMPNPIGSDSN